MAAIFYSVASIVQIIFFNFFVIGVDHGKPF